jgi:hypothetical protein
MSAKRERRPGGNGTALGNTKLNLSGGDYRKIPKAAQLSGASAGDAIASIHRGCAPVPIPACEKGPRIRGWQNLRITEAHAPRYFNGKCNIGIILGEASSGLIDVDLDCHEAVDYAPEFLPETGARFGRRSKPSSHWLYRVPGIAPSLTFRDPITGATLLELRGDGGRQTVFPPSIHPSGETIEWAANGDPPIVAYAHLRKAVAVLAARCLVAKYIPAATDGASLLRQLDTADPRVAGRVREWLQLQSPSADRTRFVNPLIRPRGDKPISSPPVVPAPRPAYLPVLDKSQRIAEITLRSFARTDLSDSVRELKDQKEPGRANLLFRKSIRLGVSIARGYIEQTEVADALVDACVCNGLVAKNGERDVRRQIERGFTCGAAKVQEGIT